MHVHILGICGTFMGGLALIARAAGHRVTGCDAGVYPPMSTQLREQGIELIEGFEADQTRLAADLYIIGNVVSRGNPLMEAILDQGLAYTSGPQWLADHILPGQHVLAVAGTHGKTTTSALLAWIFQHAGQPANFLIGGVAPDLQVSASYQPQRRHFVIEADEYDTAFFDKRSKFIHYRPRTAILNNLEFDHADIFPDLAAIETQFHHLVRTIPASGLILRPAICPPLDRVLARGCWTPVHSFGPEGRWQAQPDPADSRHCTVFLDGQALGLLDWDMAGQHNRDNALAAIAAAHHAGVPVAAALDALHAFQGVRRRLELRGIRRDIAVYDDFAHHPSAIATTIAGLRQRIGPQGRILAVLEPRSNTMKLGTMAQRLPASLMLADQVYCYGQADGKQSLGWEPTQVLAPLGPKLAWTGHDLPALVAALCANARAQDHILIMSNGGFGGIHTLLLDALASAPQ
ncbi:UDP-N-acetylmuramate:L-alanyl-gamma-D-glutamyl-meso-diaminopimelate ligase [Castellaniella sp.]|uniref:UDP-N-acetylmuramate:L-alanyl-gamma-D-glutamyl- meso-diaminopimelate ligase n=1 Tax=Castellaniella sp. TaxID=1955812 RepID=UPI002AFEB894|nr:UDP-N-acetylmuramate:L-alanyl-gamma-D-glutamyl-meso-diaminopimelate ligase [Castellaniella sp.]